jgi:hypothetical protein
MNGNRMELVNLGQYYMHYNAGIMKMRVRDEDEDE